MKLFEYNEYWETDEFEDLVARSLIGLHETKIKKEKHAPKCVRFNEELFYRFKKFGCYFAPHDRVCCINQADDNKASSIQHVDIENDGLPNRAVWCNKPLEKEQYLSVFYVEKIPFLPKNFGSDRVGTYFLVTQVMFENNKVWGRGNISVIDKEGIVESCYAKVIEYNPVTHKEIITKQRPYLMGEGFNCQDFFSLKTSATIQFYQDRRYLWNVQAYEGAAKVTFGVYPEQIRSLFYARDLPQTTTGRKRPILHWVNSHQRRMKSGTEIDIDKYLRGTHEFVMNNTRFRITEPFKSRST